MMQETIILNSKLMIPKSSSTLTRERLIPLMESVTEKKLTLVVAGAGFGKTTFVSQAVSCLGTEAVWYRLDESDVDFLTFTAHLMQGIRNRFPDRPELFQGVSGIPTSKKSREIYLLRFLSELESGVSEECVIVLDDYYLVQESKEICDAVEYLIERLPENIHLVIISRKPTGLRISKLRVMRDVSDIGEHDLEFSVSEINELYTNLLGIPVTGSTVSGLYEKTGGWAAGLVLISDILKRGDNDGFHRILAGLNRSDTHLFQYLEETMFESQPPDIQEFMLKTSLFSSMDARHCDRLLGIENSADILESLQENHLLTFSYDDDRNRFYYHHLLQEFLRDKLKRTCSRDEVRELYRSIADLLREARDDYGSLFSFCLPGPHTHQLPQN